MKSKPSTAKPGTRPPVAYCYCPFSTPDQLKGDALRRQAALPQCFCYRERVVASRGCYQPPEALHAHPGQHADQDRAP
jgi:hypothetical protein